MQALLRRMTYPAHLLTHLVYEQANRVLYPMFLHGIWWLFHFAFHLQRVDLSSESTAFDSGEMPRVPRIYVSWHGRLLGAVPLLSYCRELHVLSMPRKGWGTEGVFQASLRKAFLDNVHRKG